MCIIQNIDLNIWLLKQERCDWWILDDIATINHDQQHCMSFARLIGMCI